LGTYKLSTPERLLVLIRLLAEPTRQSSVSTNFRFRSRFEVSLIVDSTTELDESSKGGLNASFQRDSKLEFDDSELDSDIAGDAVEECSKFIPESNDASLWKLFLVSGTFVASHFLGRFFAMLMPNIFDNSCLCANDRSFKLIIFFNSFPSSNHSLSILYND
jgi:hypothetical protein